jgi:hypothetical protein
MATDANTDHWEAPTLDTEGHALTWSMLLSASWDYNIHIYIIH